VTDSIKLSEVFLGALDGKVLKLEGLEIDHTMAYDISINLLDAGSTFTVGADTYDFYDVTGNSVPAEEMTYKQMMDMINMAVTGQFPDAGYTNTATEFHDKVKDSSLLGKTFLSYDGKIQFGEISSANTKATLSLYDENSDDFTSAASVATFNTNNSLTVTDPKTDFFKSIDDIVTAVEEYKNDPDSSNGSPRGIGIQNAIARLDDLMGHVSRSHTVVGANSNTLNRALERTQTLEISTMSLRSSVVDTDLAEASLKLTQLTLNYEAMLSTVGRVSQLSLVNYL
jgi:flagellar hook-associated protein 3 FlgL